MDTNFHWPVGSIESHAAIWDYKSTVQLTAVHSVIENKLYDLPNMAYSTFIGFNYEDLNHLTNLMFVDSYVAIFISFDMFQRELTQNIQP